MKKLFLSLMILSVFGGLFPAYSQQEIVAYRKGHDTLFKAIITISRQYDDAIEICQVQRPVLINVPKDMDANVAAGLLATAKQQTDTQVLYQNREFPLGMFFQKQEVHTVTHSLFLAEGLPRVHSQSSGHTERDFVLRPFFIAGTILLLLVFFSWRIWMRRSTSLKVKELNSKTISAAIAFVLLWGIFMIPLTMMIRIMVTKPLSLFPVILGVDGSDVGIFAVFLLFHLLVFLRVQRSLKRKYVTVPAKG